MSGPVRADEVAELWALYFPGRTPEEVRADDEAEHAEYGRLLRAVRDVTDTYDRFMRAEDAARYWVALKAAQMELSRHGGVPQEFIGARGVRELPVGVCLSCYRPGAVVDNARHDDGRHPRCWAMGNIRCYLRAAYFARARWRDEDRACSFERLALDAHRAMTVQPS